jgi:hypothetical protein
MYKLIYHTNLTSEKWNSYPEFQQIIMIANEINRAGHWITKGSEKEMKNAYERAFELTDLITEDCKWRRKLKELIRFREVLAGMYADSANTIDNQIVLKLLLGMNVESYNLMRSEDG